MQSSLSGGCLCGAVRFTCSAPPSLVSYCHCRMCQKATGSAFWISANFSRDAVAWEGSVTQRRSSPLAMRGFCNACGSPLTFAYDDGDHISISVGAFDDPDALEPQQHGGVESKLSWLNIIDDLPIERTDDDPDYQALLRQTGWLPPKFGNPR